MKTFQEFCQEKLDESGMGVVRAVCMRCGAKRNVPRFEWNSGRAKCKECGGRLDAPTGQLDDSPESKLRTKIAELEADPETRKGESISDEIHVNGQDPALVHAHYGVDEKKAQEMMDKAILLFQYKKKLAKLDPNAQLDFQQ